ncbi:MAG: response regulator [Oscillospiraceae bacterium]
MKIRDKVLVIEDNESIGFFMQTILQDNGYDVVTASNGKIGEAMISSHCPDVILLDLGLPDIDGMAVLDNLRRWSSIPVIVVSARDTESDKVTALEHGADDYIHKPFTTGELLARIKVALRHSLATGTNRNIDADSCFRVGDLTIDFDKYRVFVGDRDVGLTQNEFKLVALLGRYAGKVLTYDFIIRQLWGPNAKADNQILRVNMANIRRKIEESPAEPRYIFTEVGVGYRMADV